LLELSKRAKNLKTSPTLFLVAKAKELAAQGHDVISLTVGEPDWPTFKNVSDAGIEAIQIGITKYTPANGTIELRKAIADKIKSEIGIEYSAKEISVASGAKYSIFAALQMLCSPGDEVIIATPYWVSYPTMVELADAVPRIVQCGEKENFKIAPTLLEKAISTKTRAFLFCSPSNPTGLQYSMDELRGLSEVLKRHPQVAIISDDIYNRLVFDGNRVAPHILQVAPELRERTILINGGSKAYSMTGWRIGWAAGPEKVITAMADYQSQSTGSPSSISQYALLAAIENSEAEILEVNQKLIARKKFGMDLLGTIAEFKVSPPEGAFYFWVDITACLGKSYKGQRVINSKDFCDILLNQYFVATVPGSECGTEGFMRLSFATAEDNLKRAVARMKDFIDQLV
jgi:aspartate aminotransferase